MTDNICQWVVYFFPKTQALHINFKDAENHYSVSVMLKMSICHSLQLHFCRDEMDFLLFFINPLRGALNNQYFINNYQVFEQKIRIII